MHSKHYKTANFHFNSDPSGMVIINNKEGPPYPEVEVAFEDLGQFVKDIKFEYLRKST